MTSRRERVTSWPVLEAQCAQEVLDLAVRGAMDRASKLEQLAQAKRRVSDCQDFIAQQRSLIGELHNAHRATTEAQKFLATLEELLAMHVARRDQLEQELAAPQPD